MKSMMIDYRVVDENKGTKFVRKVIDNCEFCVRDDMVYFMSDGKAYQVPIQDLSQVYTN